MSRVWSVLIAGVLGALAWSAPAAAQGTLAPDAALQFFTNSAAVCASCELNVYATGTSTRATTYSESTLTTANTNPVILDSAGRAVVYLSPGTSYRFVLTNSGGGTTYWDRDPIQAVPSSAGNVDITGTAGEALVLGDAVYLSDGSGSTTAGRWYKADADNTYSSSTSGITGIATAAIASTASGTIRIAGRMTGLSGLTAGELYYASATAGALTATPPTNQRFIGEADTTSTLILHGGAGAVKVPDSDGTHTLAFITTSNLTADRRLTFVTGDASRELTIGGDANIDQNTSTTGSPQFTAVEVGAATDTTLARSSAGVVSVEGSNVAMASNNLSVFAATTSAQLAGVVSDETGTGVAVFGTTPTFTTSVLFPATLTCTANCVLARNTSDASDSGQVEIAGGGTSATSRGGSILIAGNEHGTLAGRIENQTGNVAGSLWNVRRNDASAMLVVDGATGAVSSAGISGNTCAACGADVRIDSGVLKQDSSSLKFKNWRPLELVDARNLLRLQPISFTSLIPGDHPGWRQYGFGAEPTYSVTVGTDHPFGIPSQDNYNQRSILAAATRIVQDHETRLQQQLDFIAGIEARLKALEAENAELRARLGRLQPFGADLVAVPAGARP